MQRWKSSRSLRSKSGLSHGNDPNGRYQSNAGRRKCILFLVLCIVGLIIVLVYKPRSSSSAVKPEPPDQDTGIVLDPLPDIPPRPGLEDGSEVDDFGLDEESNIADEDDRRILRRRRWLAR